MGEKKIHILISHYIDPASEVNIRLFILTKIPNENERSLSKFFICGTLHLRVVIRFLNIHP